MQLNSAQQNGKKLELALIFNFRYAFTLSQVQLVRDWLSKDITTHNGSGNFIVCVNFSFKLPKLSFGLARQQLILFIIV